MLKITPWKGMQKPTPNSGRLQFWYVTKMAFKIVEIGRITCWHEGVNIHKRKKKVRFLFCTQK